MTRHRAIEYSGVILEFSREKKILNFNRRLQQIFLFARNSDQIDLNRSTWKRRNEHVLPPHNISWMHASPSNRNINGLMTLPSAVILLLNLSRNSFELPFTDRATTSLTYVLLSPSLTLSHSLLSFIVSSEMKVPINAKIKANAEAHIAISQQTSHCCRSVY